MEGEKYIALILEVIDSLRRRKARPDSERICHMVNRRFGIPFKDVERELERMVETQHVIKVVYKGNTSYRNASKWNKSHLSGNILNSDSDTRTILKAVSRISDSKEENRDGSGATRQEIEKFVKTDDPETTLKENRLDAALHREVDAGHLVLTASGVYAVPRVNSKDAAQMSKKLRPLKRKRIKKNHGPDFEHEPLTKLSPGDQRCDYCSLPASRNKYGEAEELLFCKDCSLKVHPSCMNYSISLAERSRLSPWQCIDCKTCHVCSDSGDADTLLFCDSCDKGYHMICHQPPLTEKPSGKWVCSLCEKEEEEMDYSSSPSVPSEAQPTNSDNDAPASTSMATSPSLPNGNEEPTERQYESSSRSVSTEVATANQSQTANLPEQSARDTALPKIQGNLAKWNIDQVADYFKSLGFTDQCTAFIEQEIDGQSLLLLKRLDVLTGLSFKLGPALKIYKHVSRLQLHHTENTGEGQSSCAA
ncbi:histone acetyltransferase KAT6A-like isoform X2 [Apostichopus japonicus]|uniref:histone acetyltransferase KAT6A-like isoform X2 n=1 Tax=Stichopus japonicus TaxID=307972 RepID=UPI003AB744DC